MRATQTIFVKAFLVFLPVLTLLGCHSMDAPSDFVAVGDSHQGEYVQRNTSADGVVVGLQLRENPKQGTLAFWSDALRNELTGRGYKLVKAEDISSNSGLAGKLMEFTTDDRGTEFTYMLAVYVTSREIVLAEGGGTAKSFAPHRDEVRKSLLTAR